MLFRMSLSMEFSALLYVFVAVCCSVLQCVAVCCSLFGWSIGVFGRSLLMECGAL